MSASPPYTLPPPPYSPIADAPNNNGPQSQSPTLNYPSLLTTVDSISIRQNVTEYTYENGRRYDGHRHNNGYAFPNDDKEQDRLDMSHHIFLLLMGGELYFAPIRRPQRILDIGTGTGIWAIDMADKFPEAEVVGTDISPIQPMWIPPNLRFIIDDAESPWCHTGPFDFIHGRVLAGSIADWTTFFKQAYNFTVPGGYMEMQEYATRLLSDDNSIPPDSDLQRWSHLFNRAADLSHRPSGTNVAMNLKYWMECAGFVDVEERILKMPYGPWHRDKRMKEIGSYVLLNVLDGLDGFTKGLFTRYLGWDPKDIETLLSGVRKDFRNPKIHGYNTVHIVWGRRPY